MGCVVKELSVVLYLSGAGSNRLPCFCRVAWHVDALIWPHVRPLVRPVVNWVRFHKTSCRYNLESMFDFLKLTHCTQRILTGARGHAQLSKNIFVCVCVLTALSMLRDFKRLIAFIYLFTPTTTTNSISSRRTKRRDATPKRLPLLLWLVERLFAAWVEWCDGWWYRIALVFQIGVCAFVVPHFVLVLLCSYVYWHK